MCPIWACDRIFWHPWHRLHRSRPAADHLGRMPHHRLALDRMATLPSGLYDLESIPINALLVSPHNPMY